MKQKQSTRGKTGSKITQKTYFVLDAFRARTNSADHMFVLTSEERLNYFGNIFRKRKLI